MSATADATPFTLPVRDAAIPAELRACPQWVAWQWERREEKWTKVPVNARTGDRAGSDNPATWTDFDTARMYAATRTNIAGIGYMFSADDPYTGIDFDTCRDPETGELDAWATATLAGFDSYAEVSPSGTGIKAFVKATLSNHGIRRKRPDDLPGGMVEMYDRGRFFTVTGHHVRDTPATIHDAQAGVDALYARLTRTKTRDDTAGARKPDDKQATRDTLTDDELIAFASRSRNGAKFTALWMGSTVGYPSHSEADIALCSLLAFYTGPDAARIDGLFHQSRLMRPKWDERHGADTYGAITVAHAVSSRTEYWQPGERYADYREWQAIQGGDTTASEPDIKAWTPPANTWPEPLADEAYYGLAGEFVRAVEPESEADPVAILGQFLVLFGNCAGRSPYYLIEADKHHTNLNLVTVGDTSSGRKGVALNRARQPFATADEKWEAKRVKGGLSSAEGLIWQVHDPIYEWQTDRKTKESAYVMKDPGKDDKRFCAAETEFAGVLRQFQRDGNNLSGLIRDAFDKGNLESLTKNSPAKATGAHISILGHITKDELLRYLDTTEAANGLGNRFLWLCVKRSKYLPDGGQPVDLAPITARLMDALVFARKAGLMTRDDETRTLWHAVYRPLSEGKPGLLGAMIARSAPIVVRLSMIYALLDCSSVIRKEHLTAAIALWDYAEASARYIFGDALGDAVADEILGALRRAPDGLTRTQISEALGRNQKADRINRSLALIERNGLARCMQIGGGPGEGRPVERWFAAMPGVDSSLSSSS